MEEILYKTMYILFDTIGEWKEMVDKIDDVRNYPDKKSGTSKYIDNPLMTAEELDEDGNVIIESKFVLPILGDLQENYPALFNDVKLVETFNAKTDEIHNF